MRRRRLLSWLLTLFELLRLLLMFLFHLLRLLLVPLLHLLLALFHLLLLLLSCGAGAWLLLHSLMLSLLLLLQFLVFLILLLRQLLLLLLVFLIRVRLSLRCAVFRYLARMIVRRPVVCLRSAARIGRPISVVICRAIFRRPAVFVRRTTLVRRTIRHISATIRVSTSIRRWIVIAAGLRSYYAASAKRRRSCRSRDRRLAVILRRAQLAIAACRLQMLILHRHWRDVPFPCRRFFLRRCAHVHAAVAAVVAHPGNIDVVLHVHVVHIAYHSFVDVVHFAVVIKRAAIPPPTVVPVSGVTPTVINSSIESHHRSPVADVENVGCAAPFPIARRPQISNLRRQYPGSRHPVIILLAVIPRPISRRPDVPISRTNRLLVHWQGWRSESHRKLNRHLR